MHIKKRNVRIAVVIGSVIIVCLVAGLIYLLTRSEISITFVKDKEILEYGQEFDSKDLIESCDGEISGYPEVDTRKIGEQELIFKVMKDGHEKEVSYTIEVKDTKAPEIKLKASEVELYKNASFNPEDYIISIEDPVDGALSFSDDLHNGSYHYQSDVDTSKPGEYSVLYQAVDLNQNKAENKLIVTVVESEADPVAGTKSEEPANTKNGEITPTYVNGILLVNKNHPIPYDFGVGGLDDETYAAFLDLQAAAGAAGFDMPLLSGYRSYDYQASLYDAYVARDGQEAADTYSARPGRSEHQTGLAMDVGQMEWDYGETPAGGWLAQHAHEFGFILRYPEGKESITGYHYEPWHIRYLGVEIATDVYRKGVTLEEYLNTY